MPKVSDLQPSPWNPRKITKEQLKRLAKSMAKFGDLSGIVRERRTRQLIGGHQRARVFDNKWPINILREAKKGTDLDGMGTVADGFVETPWGRWAYREVEWDDRKMAAANLAANKHGGAFEFGKLKDIVAELDDGALDLDLIGGEDFVRQVETWEGTGPEPGSGGDETGEPSQVKCPKCGNEFAPKATKR